MVCLLQLCGNIESTGFHLCCPVEYKESFPVIIHDRKEDSDFLLSNNSISMSMMLCIDRHTVVRVEDDFEDVHFFFPK